MESGLKNNIKQTLLFCLIGLLSLPIQAEVNVKTGFNYLNQLRENAGLTPFSYHPLLAQAALNHAQYLTNNQQHGHQQHLGQPYYTGEWASHRAQFVNYPNRLVEENVTTKSGDNSFYNPIDSLMSAIYHRFSFLSLSKDEVGIGYKAGDINAYVYVMGSSRITNICQQPLSTAVGEYFENLCANAQHKVKKTTLDENILQQQRLNPPIVTWPSDNSQQVPPVFYQESPDPLPNHSVSGYPISVQFNPAFYPQAPLIKSFVLIDTNSGNKVDTITLMNHQNDPNQQFTTHQYALFPEQRLHWNTQYKAQISFIEPKTELIKNYEWLFTTKNFDAPIITINNINKPIKLNVQQDTVLYFPPAHQNDSNPTMSYRDMAMGIKINYIDKNTLNVKAEQAGHAEISFHRKTIKLQSY